MFDSTKNKQGYCKGEDYIKKLCEKFKQLSLETINYEKKKNDTANDEEVMFYEKQKDCNICKEEFCINKNEKSEFKLYHKVRDHCHYTGKFRGAADSISNLRYVVPNEIPIVAHNTTYDHHFIIKQLAEECKSQFQCIGENDEKYITFSVPIKKENDNGKTITYKPKFIDNFRFMPTSL